MFEILDKIHFLRPWWFLALLPIAFIIWRAWQANRKQGAWHEVIDPKFRTLLLGEDSSSEPTLNEKIGYLGLATAWFLAVLALSGPWVKAVEVPAQKSQQGVVIVLDLSLSMLADDVSPNRLTRVKYRLTDLLTQYPEYATGMVAYAGSAHTISPISEDNKTLLNLLPSLNPVLMPSFGAKPLLGLQQAQQLLTGAQITQGHLLWVTDDIEISEMDSITEWLQATGYSMTVLSVGSETGGVVQIPNYGLLKDEQEKLIMPKVPLQRFADLQKNANISWQHLRPELNEVESLLPPTQYALDEDKQAETEKEVNHPLDFGYYFLFALLPFVAFIFRRGTLLVLLTFVVLPVSLFTPQTSYAENKLSDFADIFKSQNQQGYEAWELEQYETAEALFNDPQWRASALYKQGKYDEAAKLFKLDSSVQGLYNLGNALALNNQLEAAKEAYQKALKQDAEHKPSQKNLAIIEKLLAQKPPESEQSDSQNSESNPENKPAEDASENTETNPSEQDSTENKPSSSQPEDSSNQTNSTQNQNNNLQDDNSHISQDKPKPAENDTNPDNTKNQQTTADESSKPENENQAESAIAEAQNSETEEQNEDSGNASPEKLDDKDNSSMNQNEQLNPSKPAQLTEEQQAQQNWLKQIPDQPGLFLKRKFEYQYQQNSKANNENQKQW